jgi:hypothetical protein
LCASEIDRGCPLEIGIDLSMWHANGTTGESTVGETSLVARHHPGDWRMDHLVASVRLVLLNGCLDVVVDASSDQRPNVPRSYTARPACVVAREAPAARPIIRGRRSLTGSGE